MVLFTGTFENKVDQKGRVSLPADYRDLLKKKDAAGFYIFPSPNMDALEACDEEFMQRVAESIEEQADMFSDEEDALSYIVSSARRIAYDSTGRFVLPAELSDHAGIQGKAAFVGMARRFQIWNPEKYTARQQEKREGARGMTLKLKRPGADK